MTTTKAGTPMTLPQPPDEPRTSAGRTLVSGLMSSAKVLGPWGVADAVNRIEAEARATVLRDLRVAVAAMPLVDGAAGFVGSLRFGDGTPVDRDIVRKSAVLRILAIDTASDEAGT